MSLEKAKEFFKSIEEAGQTQEEYKGILMGGQGLSEEEVQGKVIGFASGKGFDISAEDIKALAAEMQNGELSDEELGAVAGGGIAWVFGAGGSFETSTGYICFVIGYNG